MSDVAWRKGRWKVTLFWFLRHTGQIHGPFRTLEQAAALITHKDDEVVSTEADLWTRFPSNTGKPDA